MHFSKTAITATAFAIACAGAAEAAHLPKAFKSVLNAEQAGTTEMADGFALLELNGTPGAATLWYSITVSEGLDFSAFGGGGGGGDMATALHIHNAGFGANGPVVYNVLTDPDTTVSAVLGGTRIEGTWDSSEGLDTYYALFEQSSGWTDFYFNLHSEDYPAGAIRGQIETAAAVPLPAAAPFLAAGLAALGAVQLRRRRGAGADA